MKGSLVVVPMWVSFTSATEDSFSGFWVLGLGLVLTTCLVKGSFFVVPIWVSFTSATVDGSSRFGFWVWVPRCRGGGLLVLVLFYTTCLVKESFFLQSSIR